MQNRIAVSDEPWFQSQPGETVLTEQEVTRSWAKLMKGEITSETFAKAETLLDELRPESPLRHRLASELDELREVGSPN
jgi:hypothetical protein